MMFLHNVTPITAIMALVFPWVPPAPASMLVEICGGARQISIPIPGKQPQRRDDPGSCYAKACHAAGDRKQKNAVKRGSGQA